MNLRKKGFLAGAVLVVGFTSFGVGMAATQDSSPPPPPWIRADGTLDRSRLPECIIVLGNDGQPVLDGKRKPVCMPSAEIFASPAAPPGEKEPKSAKILRQHKDKEGREIIEVEPKAWPFK